MALNGNTHPHLLIAVTSPLACNFYRGVLGHLQRAGFQPTVLSSPGPLLDSVSAREGVPTIPVSMKREIAPWQDLKSLCRIYRTIRRLRPAIVDASTPKAGLLTGIAAWLARVPCRVYTLRGLRLETATGLKRAILWATEWIACACAHRVVCVSPSLRARAIGLKLVSPAKSTVLGNGSQGVDLRRYSPVNRASAATESLRHSLGIPLHVPVIGFVGRFVRDKGIRQLVEAFQTLRVRHPDLHLLLVGDFEEGDRVEPEIRHGVELEATVIRPGFVSDTTPYYALMDVLVLPTYREGFPGVPLEAQASAVPVVTTRATGAVDSVIDGVTGILVPVGDASALAGAIGKLLADPELRARMGKAGRARMEQDFRSEVIWQAQVQMYRDLLQQNLRRARNQSDGNAAQPSPWPKRAFDLLVAVGALVALSPVLAAIAVAVGLFLGSPILFRQRRPGLQGQLFTCLKFRTMTDVRDANGQLLPDGERLTPLGRFLRSTSLDELPELFNVIRGEMSLVGPRPLLPQYLERYSPEQMRRHNVKPGITGWAQINGRNSLSWKERFALDLWYVDHRSFWLDLSILGKTFLQVLRRDGVSKPGHATMPEFLGVAAKGDHGNMS